MNKKLLTLIVLLATTFSTFAQWTNSGPDFGNDKIVQNGNRLYIFNTRLYHSDDNGDSWQVENTPAVSFNDLLFLTGKILAATTKGILVSYDNGISWISHSTGITDSTNGLGVASFVQLGTRIFAASPSKIYFSDNDGLSWTASNTNISSINKMSVYNGKLFLPVNSGVYISTDNGINFSLSNNGISGATPNINKIFILNNILYCSKLFTTEIYKSTDEGLTWQLSNTGLSGAIVSASVLTNVNNKLFFATGNGVYEYNEISSNWAISTINTNTSPYRIIHYNQSKYFALNLEYNLVSTINNGTNWINSASGLRMIGISPKTANNKLFGFSSIGLFSFNQVDTTWSRFSPYNYDFGGTLLSSLNTQIYCISYGAGNQYYIGTNGGVWSSNDNGVTWIQHHIGLPITNTLSGYKTVKDLYINGNSIVAATTSGIYRSTDQANTWTQVSALSCNDLQQYGSYLYATGNGVFRSSDNGLTWTAFAGATSGGPFLYITGAGGKIFTSPQASGPTSLTVYADTLANSFTTMTSNIGDAYGYGDYLFLSKFYINTALSLSNQIDMTDNLPCYYASQALGCIETYLNRNVVFGDNLWLGTTGFSTWYRSLGDFGFPVTTNEVAKEELTVVLYPNPTTNSITLQNATVKSILCIYDLNGSKVITKKLTENGNNISLDNLTNGIYFYQVFSNEGSILGQGKVIKN